ncbi:hypothetical protein K438DRAFT_1933682 [Mycena galopus ATCC 62051]|nr:hypothetical protein K438DRAFT_1933682 [Mycena galopus ATCC 62051]
MLSCPQKTCQDYAHCGLLSLKAKNYRNVKDGPTIQSNLLGAMRVLGISGLPPPMETGRCEVVTDCIGGALTNKRHSIKTTIFGPLSVAKKVDIAKLTRACIGTSSAKPTAALYQRIVYLVLYLINLGVFCKVPMEKTSKPTCAWVLCSLAVIPRIGTRIWDLQRVSHGHDLQTLSSLHAVPLRFIGKAKDDGLIELTGMRGYGTAKLTSQYSLELGTGVDYAWSVCMASADLQRCWCRGTVSIIRGEQGWCVHYSFQWPWVLISALRHL